MRIGFLLSVVLLSVPLPVGSLHQARRDTDIEQYTRERASMVAEQLRQRHLRCPCPRCDAQSATAPVRSRIRAAACVCRSSAAIGHGQTISQPFIVAYMTDALGVTRTHRVLEIGTGSGYQAAVLAHLAREVYSVEIVPDWPASIRAARLVGLLERLHS